MAKGNSDYKKIPVSNETYAKVAMIAEANGFGQRGLGAQVESWVAQELPECEHEKQAVEIEYFPSDTLPGGWNMRRTGWYCPTCRRVYAKVTA